MIGAHGNQFIIYIEGLFPGVTLGAHQSMFKEEMDGILKKDATGEHLMKGLFTRVGAGVKYNKEW